VLEQIAYSPHGGGLAAVAARLHEKAKAGDKAGLIAAFSEPPEAETP
jgi:hypothetical protein